MLYSKQVVAGESVTLTCSTTFGSEDISSSTIQYVWSGPKRNDYGTDSILSLLLYTYLRQESIFAMLHFIIILSWLFFMLLCKVSEYNNEAVYISEKQNTIIMLEFS